MTISSAPIAGDVDYAALGQHYSHIRRTDPCIAAWVHRALGDARTVLNVGAGSGSYEPHDRYVLAVEPSQAMRAQRPKDSAPAINAVAEELPLDDQSVDAAMAIITVHQWRDLDKGLQELKRVSRGPVIILTFDGEALDRYWLAHYAPELISVERPRYPEIQKIADMLGKETQVHTVPIPIDCQDGFTEAYYARPEAFLDVSVRRSQSAWSFVTQEDQSRFVSELQRDLESGVWDGRFGEWRKKPYFEGSLRLLIGNV